MPDFQGKKSSKPAHGKASDSMELEIRQLDRAETKAALDRIKPDRVTEPRCTVCNHPNRDFVETLLAQGMGYSAIASRVPEPELERRAISNHYKKHMDLQDAALREVLEREADRIGTLHEEGVKDIITTRGVLEVLMRKGFDDVNNDITTVEPKDMIQIAKMLHDMDSHVGEQAVAEVTAMFAIFQEAIKTVTSPAQQTEIALEVKRLRLKEGHKMKMENSLLEAPLEEAVDAEVVDAD